MNFKVTKSSSSKGWSRGQTSGQPMHKKTREPRTEDQDQLTLKDEESTSLVIYNAQGTLVTKSVN